jgi:hypothetical protein
MHVGIREQQLLRFLSNLDIHFPRLSLSNRIAVSIDVMPFFSCAGRWSGVGFELGE